MAENSQPPQWTPPAKIEQIFEKVYGHRPASTNSPVAGARTSKDLPVGTASLQLYSLGTPNGQKVSIMLEELGVDYDAHCKFCL
jgi:GST-like protein